MHYRTHHGRAFRILNALGKFTRENLTIQARRKRSSVEVINVPANLLILRGPPTFVHSDNSPELVAKAVRRPIDNVGVKKPHFEPDSAWENGYIESFDARYREKSLDGEILCNLKETQFAI